MEVRDYLRQFVHSRKDVEGWIQGRAFPFDELYNADLGYVHKDHIAQDGLGNTVCVYSYDKATGARRMVNNTDVPCRISAYGDSYTHGDQVNDGETWQEILAARIGEPILNFGIGGYSVSQMFRRFKLTEPNLRSKVAIMNIYEDDHYRSLVPLPQIRSVRPLPFHPPIPYVKANPALERFVEYANPCRRIDDLYDLCDLEWMCDRFRDDFAIRIMLAKTNVKIGEPKDSYSDIEELAEEYYAATKIRTPSKLLRVVNTLFTLSATYASVRMIQNARKIAERLGRKILFVTSYGPSPISGHLSGGTAMDIPERRKPSHAYNPDFVEFMRRSSLPWVDLAEAHGIDYLTSNTSIQDYLAKYYIDPTDFASHYAPLGNWFTAKAIENKLVGMLDPRPPAYQ